VYYLLAFAGGCILAGIVPWLWRRFRHSRQGTGFTYDPKAAEEAEEKTERIVAHAKDERDKVTDTADKGRSAVDDF
jgi:hypothetical protein